MIRLENASVAFNGRALFSNANWQVTEDTRVGLIGVNGSGKSTLLKVIAGRQELESGRVVRSKSFTVGYLPQELRSTSDKIVFEEALSGCGSARQLQLQIESTTRAMQDADPNSEEYHELVHEFGRLHRIFEQLDGFSVEAKTSRVLDGLAIPKSWWSLPMNQLSGGWQMRVLLAKLILSAPSLLLLDEPTNHLDVESILWLSSFLRSYEGGLVLIAHDHYFLDENTSQIIELWNGKLHFYAGNYSYYVQEKQKRIELLQSAYKNQQEEISRTEEFIERFRYKATKARQVQSRIKMLEKLERIEIPQDTRSIRLRIPEAQRSGRVALEAEDLAHKYGDTQVFTNLNLRMERGEKIALVGVNGAGKTTLLKLLGGVLEPTSGRVQLGHNVKVAYYAQIVTDELNVANTVYQEILQNAVHQDETQVRTLLGCFLFRGEDVYKRISVLSGGEKSRVALAKILLEPSNVLLLDEPTNHLDLDSKEILVGALQQYSGTVLFISHDRHFMDALAQKVFQLQDGKLEVFAGNYSEYLSRVAAQDLDSSSVEQETPRQNSDSQYHKSKDRKKEEAQKRQMEARWKKEVLEPLQRIEVEITKAEEQLRQLETILAKDETYSNKEHFQRCLTEYQTIKQALEKLYQKWEELQRLLNVKT